MKPILIASLIICLSTMLFAQNEQSRPRVELQGAGSFSTSYSSGTSPYFGSTRYYKTQTLTFTPSYGYFATDEVEFLFDLRYAYSSAEASYDPSVTYYDRTHQLGFAIGAAYNYQVNPFFTPFLAAKIRLTWDREILGWGPDTGWGKRQVSFPDFILGGRLFFTSQWAGLAFIEYTKMVPKSGWDKNETINFGVGFSVFI